jgi:hypothetical protein
MNKLKKKFLANQMQFHFICTSNDDNFKRTESHQKYFNLTKNRLATIYHLQLY